MLEQIEQNPKGLTRYPLGSFREFLVISLPLILLALVGSLMGFYDRLILSRYSIEALEACTSALAFSALFQLPTLRVISIIQAFIGKYKGMGELQKIGRCVWQMIWLSVFIFLLLIPVCFFIGPLFFKDTSIARLGIPYFLTLLPSNLLLPLGAALSSFYVGQGKTKIILYATLCGHAIHLLLDPLLIFGVKDLIPSYGLQGAAFALLAGQLVYCSFLFFAFLRKENRQIYGTNHYAFNRNQFFECLRIGIPRSLSRVLILLNWAFVVRFLTLKGGDYLLVLSFGGTIHYLFLFVVEGMGQAIVTIASYIVGIKELKCIRKLQKSAWLFIFSVMFLLSIPYLFCPQLVIGFIFPHLQNPETVNLLRCCCYWSFLYFFAQGINSVVHNLLTAFHDTLFQMIYSAIVSWVILYGAVFCMIDIWKWSPDKVWLASSFSCFATTAVYSLRTKRISQKLTSPLALSLPKNG